MNKKVRELRDELVLLGEAPSQVGEVIKVMGTNKVLVKVGSEGKYISEIGSGVDVALLKPNVRVALESESMVLHRVLPTKVDPLVSLMKVEKVPDATYDMVGGLDKQIQELKEVIELPIKHPELFEALGVAQPKGVLMYGPPGTGKTLLARAVAHHTDCTFIRVSGAELVQKYIGEGARMVRELFVMAREAAPTIIFMDEVDSIGSSRGDGGGDSEVQRTMMELLNQLDGFEPTQVRARGGPHFPRARAPAPFTSPTAPPPHTHTLPRPTPQTIKVIMATNRIDILDAALLRPGRIDRKVEFPHPNEEARLSILQIHSRRMNLVRGINLKKVAGMISSSNGAECKAVCTEAGMFALRERRVHVTQEDFELAVGKVMRKTSEMDTSILKLFK